MTAPWYDASGAPVQRGSFTSAQMRAEFALIEAAFDQLPSFSGNGGKVWAINASGNGVEASASLGIKSDGSLAIGIAPASANIEGWGRAITLNGPADENAALELALNGTLAGFLSYSETAGSIVAFNVYAYAAVPLIFGVGNAEKMRIAADGRIALGAGGIATAVDVAVRGTTNNSAQYGFAVINSDGDVTLRSRNDGLLNTGTRANSPYNLTTGSAANLHVTSDGNIARSTSSIKYKRDVESYDGAIEAINALRPVRFRSKPGRDGQPGIDGDRVFGGLIAEEVHAAGLTEYVEYDAAGQPDAVMYSHLVALTIRGIQQLDRRVDALERAGGRK